MLTDNQVKELFASKLNQFDSELIRPIDIYTWTRDLPIVEDLDKTVQTISLRNIQRAGQGTTSVGGKSWIGESATDMKGVDVFMGAKAVKVFTAGREAAWSSMELDRAKATGDINLDTEKVEAIHDIFQQEAQSFAYLGDSSLNATGLFNSSEIEKDTGAGTLAASSKTFDAIAAAFDEACESAYENSGNVIMPNTVLVCPEDYVTMFGVKAKDDSKFSVIDYIENYSLARKVAGSMKVLQCKELKGIGTSSKNRMLFYTKDSRYLRFHTRPMWREKMYDRGLDYCAAYIWRFAEVQFRHPETLFYFDNL